MTMGYAGQDRRRGGPDRRANPDAKVKIPFKEGLKALAAAFKGIDWAEFEAAWIKATK